VARRVSIGHKDSTSKTIGCAGKPVPTAPAGPPPLGPRSGALTVVRLATAAAGQPGPRLRDTTADPARRSPESQPEHAMSRQPTANGWR